MPTYQDNQRGIIALITGCALFTVNDTITKITALTHPIGEVLVVRGFVCLAILGIAIAVPAVLVYNYFLRRLKLTAADLDDFAHDFYSLAQKSAFRVIVHPATARKPVAGGKSVKEAS